MALRIKGLQSFGSSTGKQTFWLYSGNEVAVDDAEIELGDYFLEAVRKLGMRDGDVILAVYGWGPITSALNPQKMRLGVLRKYSFDGDPAIHYYFVTGQFRVGALAADAVNGVNVRTEVYGTQTNAHTDR
mmetsp:Transcript_6120/g.3466  ORF Transcript_6120/g.3466 Transcript_6120/m.3466 type:complete len:130 (-) Transcript_6120:421-810(-)